MADIKMHFVTSALCGSDHVLFVTENNVKEFAYSCSCVTINPETGSDDRTIRIENINDGRPTSPCSVNENSEELQEQFQGQLQEQFQEPLQEQFQGQLQDPFQQQLQGQFQGQFQEPLQEQFQGQLSEPFQEKLQEQFQEQPQAQFQDQMTADKQRESEERERHTRNPERDNVDDKQLPKYIRTVTMVPDEVKIVERIEVRVAYPLDDINSTEEQNLLQKQPSSQKKLRWIVVVVVLIALLSHISYFMK